MNRVFGIALLLGITMVFPACNGTNVEPEGAVATHRGSPSPAARCGDPDPSVVLLDDADIYDISDGDLITVIAEPFEDDAVVGAWIQVRTTEDLPVEFFQIISNEHFDQNNISVFTVAEDLENAGGSHWWFYDGQTTFDIVGSTACLDEPQGGRGDFCEEY